MDSPELDRVIAELEALTARLESAPPSRVENELSEVSAASSELIRQALAPDEGAAWQKLLDDALQRDSAADGSVSSDDHVKEKTNIVSLTHFGAFLESTENDKCNRCQRKLKTGCGKLCIHGCSAVYCTVDCRKKSHREHVSKCKALEKRILMKSIGLSSNSDGELF